MALEREDEEKRELALASKLIAIVGVGYLFPFSALTQPIDFWHKIFPHFNIEFPLTTLYMTVNLVFLSVIVFLSTKPSYISRIVGGLLGQFLVLMIVPSLYFFHLSEDSYYMGVMISTAFAAIVTAVVDSVAIGFAAHYPVEVQSGLQFGIGLSTLIGSVYRIITKLIFPPEQVVESSLIYFYAGAGTIILCIAAFYKLLSLKISKKYFFSHYDGSYHLYHKTNGSDTELIAITKESHRSKLDDEESSLIREENDLSPLYTEDVGSNTGKHRSNSRAVNPPSGKQESPAQSYGSIEHEHTRRDLESLPSLTQYQLLMKCLTNELLVFLLFFSTLLLWPAMVTEIPSYTFTFLQESSWWSLLLLLLFSVCDCIGRLLTSSRGSLTPENIYQPILGRLLLIPLFISIVRGRVHYLRSDLLSVLLVGVLGFTNGYHGSLAVMMVSEVVQTHERGNAGALTGFFLNFGLVFGAIVAMYLEPFIHA